MIKQRRQFDNRGHFFAIATKLMIRVLIDYQRHRQAAKRGGGLVRVSLDPRRDAVTEGSQDEGVDVEALARALEQLEALDARKADVVKLHVFWHLKLEEIAEALGIGLATVNRDWSFAKAWLLSQLQEANI